MIALFDTSSSTYLVMRARMPRLQILLFQGSELSFSANEVQACWRRVDLRRKATGIATVRRSGVEIMQMYIQMGLVITARVRTTQNRPMTSPIKMA